jgi:arginase family enzyme
MHRRAFELIGVPFDGGATLGWPGSRYAPARIRSALAWMTMRIQGGQIYALGTAQVVKRVLEHTAPADHRFLAIDIDAIDPAYAPGAGAHEPGGLTSRFALDAVRALAPHCASFLPRFRGPAIILRRAR